MDDEAIIIRLAGINDATLIAGLSRQTFYDSFASQNTKENMDKFMSQAFGIETLMAEVGSPGNIFLLAYISGKPVGYARMKKNGNPEALKNQRAIEIARLYAVQDAIGKGVGKALMQGCIDLAKKKNEKTIWLGVWEHNERAIAFYSKWGFEKFDSHVFMLGDDRQIDWLMKKSL